MNNEQAPRIARPGAPQHPDDPDRGVALAGESQPRIFRAGEGEIAEDPTVRLAMTSTAEAATTALAPVSAEALHARSVLDASKQRFGAGTTYGGPAARGPSGSPPAPQPVQPSVGQPAPPPAPAPAWVPQQPPPTPRPPVVQPAIDRPGAVDDRSWAPVRPPSATPEMPGASPGMGWLVDPKNRKTVMGGAALAVAALLFLAGPSGVKVVGLLIAAAAWVVFFRVAPSDTATFRIRTRLDQEEIAGLAVQEAANSKGALSRVVLQSGTAQRLDFVVYGTLSRPLEFGADMAPQPDGTISVTTTIDTWTRNRTTIWFIPIPFSSTIDGFRGYKSFGDRWMAAIRHYDPSADTDYVKKPH